VLNWLAEHLDFQTDATPGGGAWGGPLGAIILWIVLILLVVGLAWIIASVVRGRVRRKRTAVDEATIEIEASLGVGWQAEAERHEAGDWGALRCRLRSWSERWCVGACGAPGRTGELRSDATTVPSAAGSSIAQPAVRPRVVRRSATGPDQTVSSGVGGRQSLRHRER
jgi:hypothetical protein